MGLLRGVLRNLRRGATPSAEALHGQLEEAIAQGDQRAALELSERILALHADDARALWAAAVINFKSGNVQLGVSYFARLEDISSGGGRSTRLVRESLMDPERAASSVPYVARLDDVLLDPGYWAVIDGDRLYTRETQGRTIANSPIVGGRVTRDGRQCVVSLPRAPERIEEPCILLGSDQNYAHWVLRNLPKLSLLERADVPPEASLLVRDDLRRWQLDYLELIGIPESRLRRVREGDVVACRRLYVPTQLNQHPRLGDGLAWLRARLAPLLVPPERATDLVYASRREHPRRKLLNESEVEAALAPLGFHTIVPGEMSVREQIEAFSRARVVVAPHGAGLANMAFAPPGAALVEIASSAIAHMGEFRHLCEVAGMRIRSVTSSDMDEEASFDGGGMHRHYRVDVDELLSAVGEALASRSGA